MGEDETVWTEREFDGHDFRDDDLRRLSTERVVFTECRMRPMKLIEVDFTLAVLGGADLRGVDLSDCRMREASLVEADLRKAVLRRADLSGARLQNAKLDEADLRGARVDPTLWTAAALRGAKVDIEQAMAYAAAHGLDIHGE